MEKEIEAWKKAKSPNYETNKDKLYPYSEMSFEKEYKLVMIPICVKNLIEHVDYFGSGRRELQEGTKGFPNCYNVNYWWSLVPNGQDKGRKIPNRIPIVNDASRFAYTSSNYIKDNSVLTVTVDLSWEVREIIAKDIVRIVNSDRGKVIIYGWQNAGIDFLTDELKRMKQLFYCPIYLLPNNLHLTYWKTCYRAYLNINELKRELYKNVNKGDIEAAVILTGSLNNSYSDGAIGDVVNKLLENNLRSVIEYAYKLWNYYDKDVVRMHFPSLFQQMFDGDSMAIVNKQNNQALVLDPNTKKARGDYHYKSGNEEGWKIIPILDENNVLFKLYNVRTDTYLQQASDAKDSKELRDKFYFEPLTVNGQVAFKIFCFDDDKPLELPIDADSSEVKAEAVGHKSADTDQNGRSTWILTTANQVKEKSKNKDELTLSDDEDFSNIYIYD